MLRPRTLPLTLACLAAVSVAAPVAQAASTPRSGQAIPPGFVVSSTSWTSATDGWLLGFRPCSGAHAPSSCPNLFHTTDGGGSWQRAVAPQVRVSPRFRQVKVVFGSAGGSHPAMGLASDGTRLFVSLDGATSWQRATRLPFGSGIGDLGLTATSAYAIVGTGTTDDGTTSLFRTLRGENDWEAVPGVHTAGNGVNVDGGYDLGTRGRAGAVALGRIFLDLGYWTTLDGTTWQKRPAPCTKDQVPSFNRVDRHRVVATCSYDPGMSKQVKDVRVSVGGGDFTTTTSAPIDLFTTATSAAAPASPFIGATAAGVGWLYGTFDDGDTWQTVLKVDDELPFYDLQFPDSTHGFVVSGGSAYARGAVYTTADSGRTWHPLDLG